MTVSSELYTILSHEIYLMLYKLSLPGHGQHHVPELVLTVVIWAYSLDDCVGALPMYQELAVGAGEKQENVVTWLEFLRVDVSSALLDLGCLQVLPYNWCDFVNSFLHFLYTFDKRPVG